MEHIEDGKWPTVTSFEPRAIAADKKASAEFGPEVGALIALQAYVGTPSLF